MIRVTRLNGSQLVINALLIERVEATPDTIVRLTTGTQYVVRESRDDVCEMAVDFLRSIRSDNNSAPIGQMARLVR